MASELYNQDIISVEGLSESMIHQVLDYAFLLKKAKTKPLTLDRKVIGCCFFEPSTRTRLSFEAAIHTMGGDVIGFCEAKNTSVEKGETLADSMTVIDSYVDAIVLRHPSEGAACLAAEYAQKPVINAGDGKNQHPTQTLLDLFTIRETQQRLEDLHIGLVGDLKHGRTVQSLVKALSRFNARFYFVSPEGLSIPKRLEDDLKASGCRYSFHVDLQEIMPRLDVLYVTRLQKERFDPLEFKRFSDPLRLTMNHLKGVKDHLKIMHPLPRVDEIDTAIDRTPYAYYFQQAANGLPVRQALLSLILNEEAGS